jgi:hypothetical protein
VVANFLAMEHRDMRSLTPEAQEERRRQVIGLRESGLTYEAIGLQVGLTRNGVFDICKRFRESGMVGLQTGPRGPAPGARHRAVPHRSPGGDHAWVDLPRHAGCVWPALCAVGPGGGRGP